ncbi:hypothetical protein AAFF_G00296550 [Aldrovandia affinis]|uniref:Protein-serine/threonine phosphatase n=1 Tax=Aldrovandia affinis TaxID=143900 RepID=A0AAD7WSH7_9TELE|nr:hypothetical protein AAFF_G00296550 [Aldrovandia affinis]
MCMAHDRHGLWKIGITHILNAAHGKKHCQGCHNFYGATMDYHGVPANDLPTFDISPYFYPSADYIHKALNTPGARIFVHCAVGVSRSASLVLAYLMIYHHFTLVDAIRKVKENRAIAQNRTALQKIGITHILNAAHSKQGSIGDQSFYGSKFVYCGIPADDSTHFDLNIYFRPAAEFIHKALKQTDGKILVHCIMGMSRSSTLVLAYLMLYHRLPLCNAIKKVIQKRAIYPNRNFLALLLDLDLQLRRKQKTCLLL